MTALGTHIGRYEMLRLLSSGGMGEVYLARQTSAVEGFATLAAIKVLLKNLSTNRSFVEMFLEEARIVGRLQHKNIVQIRDIAEHDGHYYMVMEYIPGQTLRELLGDASIRDRPLFDPRLGCQVFSELASALASAHAAGLIHRDISPNNIMISDDGVPKLIDFGIARAVGSASLTSPGTLKGKFGYMAPEYVRGEAYDARVDVFSLGIVMWETFARKRLFRGSAIAEQLHQMLQAEIPRLDAINPDIPAELADLVADALERDPARRIGSALMLSEALAALTEALPAGPDPTLRRWLERRIKGRMDDRRQTDQTLMTLPHGAAIPDFGPAVDPGAASGPSSYSGGSSGSGRHSFREGPGSRPDSNGAASLRTSMLMGQVSPSHELAPPPLAPAPRGRGLMFGAIGAALALAVALIAMMSMRPAATPAPTAAAVGPTDAAPAGSGAMSLAEAHRQIGLKAMADGNYGKARSEYAEALRQGGGGDLVQLMQLATQLEGEEAAAAAPVAATPPPPGEPAPAPTMAVLAPSPKGARAAATVAAAPRRAPPPASPSTPSRAPDGRDEKAASASAIPAPAETTPGGGYLVATSVIAGALVVVDDTTVGQTPLRIPLAAGDHRLVFTRNGAQVDARSLRITNGETARVHVENEAAPPAPRPQAPVAKAPVKPVVAPTRAPTPTPRVTGTGDAGVGAQAVGACNACHTRAGAGAVAGRRYTQVQWDRFFATGQHDRYVPIGDQMSAGQLAAVKAFLRTKAADAPENQGAGVRE